MLDEYYKTIIIQTNLGSNLLCYRRHDLLMSSNVIENSGMFTVKCSVQDLRSQLKNHLL